MPDYNTLIQLRTVGSNPSNPIPPVTTLASRSTGKNIVFTTHSYEEYKMRRKVGVLQYNTSIHLDGKVETKNQQFSHFARVRGSSQFSQKQLKIVQAQNCPEDTRLRPPTNSGIRDRLFPGYKLNKAVTFSLYL